MALITVAISGLTFAFYSRTVLGVLGGAIGWAAMRLDAGGVGGSVCSSGERSDQEVRERLNPEARLAQLTAASGPLRRTLAAVCSRLLDTQAFERLCYARLRDYARERAGVSARQLQDLAHAHRAFATLPALERALVANELPWSKVRLLVRVATPEDQSRWIERARMLSIRHLEQEVRAARGPSEGALDAEADPPRVRVMLHCTPAVREQWLLAREYAERVSGQRLREDEALEWVTAEALSAVSIDAARIGIGEPEPAETSRCARAASDEDPPLDKCVRSSAPDALADGSASLDPLLAGLDEADAFELDRRLRAAIRREQTLDAAIAPLLRILTSPHHEWDRAYWKLADFAAEQLGMSPSKARALLRIERAGDACPELRTSFRDGRVSWAKAQCLLPLLLLDIDSVQAPDWRRRWVAWAERVTVRRLEADVDRALLLRAGHGPAFERCLADPARARDPIPEAERQMCAPDIDVEATERLEWRAPREVASLFVAVRESVRARLRNETGRPVSESDAFAAMLDHALATWTLRDPTKPRPDPVFERDGYLCAVPGCSSRMSLHDHHVVFRSHQGSDEMENLLTLCAFHHQRCLHAGRLRIQGLAPNRLVFELGVRPGAPPLARYRSGDVLLTGHESRSDQFPSADPADSRVGIPEISQRATEVRPPQM